MSQPVSTTSNHCLHQGSMFSEYCCWCGRTWWHEPGEPKDGHGGFLLANRYPVVIDEESAACPNRSEAGEHA